MKFQRKALILGVLFASMPTWAAERIVVLTPDVASVVAALGAGGEVVGRDRSSRFPELSKVPEVGFHRSLNVEPIARLRPTLILGGTQAQPTTIWHQFKTLGFAAHQLGAREDGADFPDMVKQIGKLLNRSTQADALAKTWAEQMKPRKKTGLRYLFTYDGNLVAGKNTAPDTLIRVVGGENVATHDGYKPLNKEAWFNAKPDVVVIAAHQHAVTGGVEGMKKRPELQKTPAVLNQRVYEIPADRMFRIDLSSPKTVDEISRL